MYLFYKKTVFFSAPGLGRVRARLAALIPGKAARPERSRLSDGCSAFVTDRWAPRARIHLALCFGFC